MSRKVEYIVILVLASLWIDAYDFTAFSFATALFKSAFPWMSSFLFGFAVASVRFGGVTGNVVGGWLTDRVGRKTMFITLILLLTVAAIG
jgi:MFS family permease